ncbi:MAG: SIS domain-containing protein [Proteobacteria bacterium]|nr:SIS domain-containing protein [Pseudomonadota bacterium]
MQRLGYSEAEIDAAGAHWTVREILQQPRVWAEVADADPTAVGAFLGPLLAKDDLRIVLTGAGTSAYVGECLAPALTRRLRRRVEAVATTDIVAGPAAWLADAPTLLVSFARSGNSPESLAALDMAAARLKECWHLIVTCNADGALYRRGRTLENACVILLPEASNDRGFAMTSSFTGMVLAGALALGVLPAAEVAEPGIGRLASQVWEEHLPRLRELVRTGFDRAVFLGSNELKGLAREAALKMLELTDGRVVALADSPLGFRHGPKTVLNRSTLVVIFLSGDPATRRYEDDLVSELRRDGVAGHVVTLATGAAGGAGDDLRLAAPSGRWADLALLLPYAAFAQLLATLRSISLAVRPDTPSASGTVSRVVQGVTIYPAGA